MFLTLNSNVMPSLRRRWELFKIARDFAPQVLCRLDSGKWIVNVTKRLALRPSRRAGSWRRCDVRGLFQKLVSAIVANLKSLTQENDRPLPFNGAV